jgi:hypothetical protein
MDVFPKIAFALPPSLTDIVIRGSKRAMYQDDCVVGLRSLFGRFLHSASTSYACMAQRGHVLTSD